MKTDTYALLVGTDDIVQFRDWPTSAKVYDLISTAVDGLIERVPLVIDNTEFDVWVNEEGLLYDMAYNSTISMLCERHLVGNAVITACSKSGNMRGLSEKQVMTVLDSLILI